MIDNINNLGVNPKTKQTDLSNRGLKKESSEAVDTSKAAVQTESEVQLSDQAKKLDSLKSSIMNTPDIDQAKVEKIRNALANDEYQVNAENLAEKMLKSFAK